MLQRRHDDSDSPEWTRRPGGDDMDASARPSPRWVGRLWRGRGSAGPAKGVGLCGGQPVSAARLKAARRSCGRMTCMRDSSC